MPAAEATSGAWFDIDALPPGALFRLGTNTRHGDQVAAIADDGRIATFIAALGLVEIGPDWRVRRVPRGASCRPRALRYVDGGLLAACDSEVIRWGSEGPTGSFAIECARGHVFSPGGSHFACNFEESTQEEARVYDTTSGARWSSGSFGYGRWSSMVVSDRGVVIVPGEEALVAYSSAGVLWRMPGQHWTLGLEPSGGAVVSWEHDAHSFYVLSTKDGTLERSAPARDLAFGSNIQVLPGAESWLVRTGDGALARVDGHSGAFAASWPVARGAKYSAVSATARWAVVSGGGAFTRLDVDAPAAPADPPTAGCEVLAMSAAPSGDRMVVSCFGARLHVFDMKTGGLLGTAPLSDTISTVVPVAMAPSGVTVAAGTPYGSFRLLEGTSLSERCRRDEVHASSLHWSGDHVVAVFDGANGDAPFREATVTVMDSQCRLVAPPLEHDGRIIVLGADSTGLDLVLTPGRGDIMDPKAVVRRVAFADGAATSGSARVLLDARERTRSGAGLEVQAGTTRVVVQGRSLHCVDGETGRRLSTHALPPTVPATPSLTLAPNGAWVAVEDVASVLVYPCRSEG